MALGKQALLRDTEARYHLKIDTGMHRIGVSAEDAAEFARSLSDFPGLSLEGTFTHFATADIAGDWDVQRQLERFARALEEMKTEGIDPGIVHAANSPATILYPEAHFDMVRCGIALYGLHPSKATYGVVELRPAMSVKARASLVKRIAMGDGRVLRSHVDALLRPPRSPRCRSATPMGCTASRQTRCRFCSAVDGAGRSGACAWTSS